MSDASFNLIFDIVEIMAGLYILYSAYRMKTSGEVSPGLVGKNVNLSAARDIPGFIRKMFPVYLICGSIFTVVGLVSLYFDQAGIVNMTFNIGATVLLLAICLVFAWITKSAQEQYL